MSLEPPVLQTDRLILRLATAADASQIVAYYQTNQAFLKPFEPERSPEFLTIAFWLKQVDANLRDFHQGRSIRLFVFKQEDGDRIIGSVNFSSWVRGAFHACYLGYSLSEMEQGQGYMTEALQTAIYHVFEERHLHRIMANYLPQNQRSGRLLRRLGFVVEGYARDYLLINGRWQDHILTSLTNPNWIPVNDSDHPHTNP